MKNLIIIALLSLAPVFVFAQITVKSPTGNVGIAHSNPSYALHVDKDVFTWLSRFSNREVDVYLAHGNTGNGFFVNTNAASGSQYAFYLKNDMGPVVYARNEGKVGIGTLNTSQVLTVGGKVAHQGLVLISDKRLKKDVTQFKYGLKEIMQLQPLVYDYTGKGGTVSGKYNVGLFAQDLQKIAPEFVTSFTDRAEDKEGNFVEGETYLSIYDTGIKYMLVNAVQEQQDIIESQKDEIATLREEVSEMKEMMQAILNGQNTNTNQQNIELNGNGAYLEQNQPNPFNNHTLIKYSVPTDATDALVNIFNETGQLIHSELITQTGVGQIQVKAGTIPAGTYSYSLVVNGKITDTKRMVIVK